MTETLAYGNSSASTQRELSNEYTCTRQRLDYFQKSLHPCALDESSLGIGRVMVTAGDCVTVNHTSGMNDIGYSVPVPSTEEKKEGVDFYATFNSLSHIAMS